MKTFNYFFVLFYLFSMYGYADNNADKTSLQEKSNPRIIRVLAGFCTNYITGYDYHDKEGYGAGPGFRAGFGIDVSSKITVESDYTLSFHESDSLAAKTLFLNGFDINLKYKFLRMNKITFYMNLGMGLDLFTPEGPDIGQFSYIPHFGIGAQIYINEWIDTDIGLNLHPVRFKTNDNHRPDATYLQFLLILNFKS